MEGGKRAAVALRDAVDNKCSNLPSKMEIVVKVCANLSGLATALCKAGSISSESLFKQFTLGFTQAKASFDFIDVGHGKERADSKIRGRETHSSSFSLSLSLSLSFFPLFVSFTSGFGLTIGQRTPAGT